MYRRRSSDSKKPEFRLTPDFIADSVSQIDFDYLKSKGITTCFIDLDGTVVDRGSFEVEPMLTASLKKSGLDIKIATNRPKSRSLKNLKNSLNASGVIHPKGIMGKPSKAYIRNALNLYNLQQHEVVMIGDRVFQDILGANRSGIYSLLVYKLGESKGRIDQFISRRERAFTDKLLKDFEEIVR